MGYAECIEVALPVPVDATYTYGVPDAWRGALAPGCRVVVPYGGRRLTGVVLQTGLTGLPEATAPRAERRASAAQPSLFDRAPSAAADAAHPHALRVLERVVDRTPVLGEELLRIVTECAEDVCCPVGIALAAALPGAGTPRARRVFGLSARGREALAAGSLRADLRPLFEALGEGPKGAKALAERGAEPAALRALVREGLLEERVLEKGPVQVPALRVAALVPGASAARSSEALRSAPRQVALLRHLEAQGPTPVAELAATSGGARAALHALENKGLVEIRSVARTRRGALGELARGSGPGSLPALTEDQERARAAISQALREERFEGFLLHGVTGSGKTEVYLRAIAEALACGRQALVLVPEITLTHQLVARLEDRFGAQVAVLHSGLGAGERVGEWHRLRAGDTPIAVGARSALFAPLERLGVIIVDEEHEGAYKNEEGFRYHGVDLARRRAVANRCPLVLGSATPSLETRHAAECGELRRLVLPRRVGGRPLPRVELVSLEEERATLPRGRTLIFSRALHEALGQALAERSQAILFLNRRGFSTRIFCFQCGHAERCEHCDVSLVYHAPQRVLRCHYCDAEREPPDHCAQCGAPDTALLGLGTQRLEEEVRRLFPDARIARLDRDNSMRRGATESILGALSRGEVDILVGTQMVAKGHDFPGVRLVGVIAADLGLHHPDFRAAERTFQLLTQVAGRAGRGLAPGRVIVQTFSPEHYAIRHAAQHDYEAFFREEMRQRSALGYPPYTQILRVLATGDSEESVRRTANALVASLGAPDPAAGTDTERGFEILGPAPAPLARLRDRDRAHFLIKTRDAKQLRELGRRLAESARRLESGSVRVSIDLSPISML